MLTKQLPVKPANSNTHTLLDRSLNGAFQGQCTSKLSIGEIRHQHIQAPPAAAISPLAISPSTLMNEMRPDHNTGNYMPYSFATSRMAVRCATVWATGARWWWDEHVENLVSIQHLHWIRNTFPFRSKLNDLEQTNTPLRNQNNGISKMVKMVKTLSRGGLKFC